MGSILSLIHIIIFEKGVLFKYFLMILQTSDSMILEFLGSWILFILCDFLFYVGASFYLRKHSAAMLNVSLLTENLWGNFFEMIVNHYSTTPITISWLRKLVGISLTISGITAFSLFDDKPVKIVLNEEKREEEEEFLL